MNWDKDTIFRLIEKYFSRTVADLILINQIPAPTFGEKRRADLIRSRLQEFGIKEARRDRAGNVYAVIPARRSKDHILVFANLDGAFSADADVLVKVDSGRIVGNGIGNNSLGLAALLFLAEIIKEEKIALSHNLVILAAASSRGEGNALGMQRFIERFRRKILFGICLEGRKLGRIDHWAFGSARFQLVARARGGDSWNDYPFRGAIDKIHRVAESFVKVPFPRVPKTVVNITQIEGGSSFGQIPERAKLEGEILSDDMNVVEDIAQKFQKIVDRFISRKDFDLRFKILSRRPTGGIPNYHFLVELAAKILEELGVKWRLGAVENDMGVLLARGIPAVTLGLAETESAKDGREFVHLNSFRTGLCQLLMMLKKGQEKADEFRRMDKDAYVSS